MRKKWYIILIAFVSCAQSKQEYSDYQAYYENISSLLRIDAYAYLNKKLIEQRINGKKWCTHTTYRESILKSIPIAIKTVYERKDVNEVISFDRTDIKNYTNANYNALVLYNIINVLLNLSDPKFNKLNKILLNCENLSHAVLDFTKELLVANFNGIDKLRLEKSIKDISEYDSALNLISYIACINSNLTNNKTMIEICPKLQANKITPQELCWVHPYEYKHLENAKLRYSILRQDSINQIVEYDVKFHINNGKLCIDENAFFTSILNMNNDAESRIKKDKNYILDTMLKKATDKQEQTKIKKLQNTDYWYMTINALGKYERIVMQYMQKELYPQKNYKTYFTIPEYDQKRTLQEIMNDLDM